MGAKLLYTKLAHFIVQRISQDILATPERPDFLMGGIESSDSVEVNLVVNQIFRYGKLFSKGVGDFILIVVLLLIFLLEDLVQLRFEFLQNFLVFELSV